MKILDMHKPHEQTCKRKGCGNKYISVSRNRKYCDKCRQEVNVEISEAYNARRVNKREKERSKLLSA